MPMNPATGKTDRRMLRGANVQEYRRQQTEIARNEYNREKERGRTTGSPFTDEPSASGLAPSPLVPLAGLESLTLKSGRSSATNTPADSPNTLPQPSLPENPAPAPPASIETYNDPKASAGKSVSKLPTAAPTLGT
jgi:hypothetical protein